MAPNPGQDRDDLETHADISVYARRPTAVERLGKALRTYVRAEVDLADRFNPKSVGSRYEARNRAIEAFNTALYEAAEEIRSGEEDRR